MSAVTQNTDEIDLIGLFLRGVNTVRNHFWLILMFFFLGTILGLTYYYSARKVYESKMLISSAILTKSYSKTLINRINTFRREGNYSAIMDMLHVPEETARGIAHLDIDIVSETDNLKETDRLILTAEVLDLEILDGLQKGLIHYLENNDYVKIRVQQNKTYIGQVVTKLDGEIADMENLKKRIIDGTFFETSKGNLIFNPTEVNSKIIELTKERIKLQNELELINSVQIIEGFAKFKHPKSPRLSVSIVSGAFVGLIFVTCLLAFKSIRKILRMADSAKQNA